MNFYQSIVKRFFDFFMAIILMIVLSPLFLIITLLLAVVNEGKPFFVQERPGFNGTIFKIVKFKTMNDKRDAKGELLPDTQRLTKVGTFARRFSFDEIPQLINVIKGEMSFIGPRPLLVKYLPLYNKEQMRRHAVKPGISGWAQVNGRNAIDWDQKFSYDLYYVDNISFLFDLKILFLSVYKVLKKEGVNSSANQTMPEFTGNNN